MDASNGSIRVLMFPWLAHGHVSPFLELAKKLSRRNFYIYFYSTPVILCSIHGKLTKEDSLSIEFVELHLPSLPDLPPHYHTTNGLPPHLMPVLKKALDLSSTAFANILNTLNPHLLIYDAFQPWAPAAASSHNIPAVLFSIAGAAITSFALHLVERPGVAYPFPEILLQDFWWLKLRGNLGDSPDKNDDKDGDAIMKSFKQSCGIILIKTFTEIEPKYMDYLSVLTERKTIPVGSLVDQDLRYQNNQETESIFEWLNKRDQRSVVFVAFGSEYFLAKEEIEEIAHGLELSKINFIWVVRFPHGLKTKAEQVLPVGFLSRVGERGMVVEGWAPQRKILGYGNIGGFMSHCGWSSVVESMKFGVPIVAVPMQLDQPVNAKLVESVGVGFEVQRDENGRLEREEIAKVIEDVVIKRTGEDVRRKARELSDKIIKKGDEEMRGVIDELVQLCGNQKCLQPTA